MSASSLALRKCGSTIHPSCSRSATLPSRHALSGARSGVRCAAGDKEPTTSVTKDGKVVIEYIKNGTKIIESSEPFTGPEDVMDFWEADNMEGLGGFVERWFLPMLIVLGLICGSIAANTYSEDAVQEILGNQATELTN
eukprot:gene29709-5144_t